MGKPSGQQGAQSSACDSEVTVLLSPGKKAQILPTVHTYKGALGPIKHREVVQSPLCLKGTSTLSWSRKNNANVCSVCPKVKQNQCGQATKDEPK